MDGERNIVQDVQRASPDRQVLGRDQRLAHVRAL